MIFVDTSYFFAMLDRRDQLHARAVAWHGLFTKNLITTEYVLWEVLNGFSASDNRSKAHAAFDDIRSRAGWRIVGASADLFQSGLALHRQSADKEWALTDCISFVVMRELSIQQALTFDRHFEQAGFEALLRRDPP